MQRYKKPRNVPLLSYFLGVGGWCWESPWVREDYKNGPQSIRLSLKKKTLLGSVCHFSHSPPLALKRFSMRGHMVLGGGHCWEIYGGIFGHPNDLRDGSSYKEANTLPTKELFTQIPVMPQLRNRQKGSWKFAEITCLKKTPVYKSVPFPHPQNMDTTSGHVRPHTFSASYALPGASEFLQRLPWSVSPLLKDKSYFWEDKALDCI